jgi:hypothetical protein
MRDPEGYLIEVGQTTMTVGASGLARIRIRNGELDFPILSGILFASLIPNIGVWINRALPYAASSRKEILEPRGPHIG